MRVVIAGGHGQIALRLERQLAEAGHEAVGLVRNPDHVPDLEKVGARGVVLDLEQASAADVAAVVSGADAVVFAAGGGPNSGAARKDTVDRAAAALLADAAEQAGVRRYLMVSSMGTDQADPDSDQVFQVYLRAKAAADEDLRGRDLDWTIVRPGRLTDDEGTGSISLDPGSDPREIPREDVAAVLLAALGNPATIRRQFTVLTGQTPVAEALAGL
ncbi:SDR family oxidoreductase [Nocardioides sp. WL0053]|uniref:SDR family oxidoreductase n=1 Tax=Nocardioides jiangsuensis TaxID=2866161 RepID=A0ABS7RQD0_9ACTN|nr:SDR family oxidoreductase [Nocardioides jiangsuensis]MBY9076752.1 SDR family oxidoreductase [Nocardioides jiangsuensis]